MSGSILFIQLYSLLLIWLLFLTYRHVKQLSIMVGMMVAMVLAMTVGLGGGVLLGVVFPEYYFYTTCISIAVGAAVGIVFGFPFQLLAVLDGLLAGVMGGMMGVMLGVMIPAENSIALLKLFGLLTAVIFFLVFLLVTDAIKNGSSQKNIFYQPAFFFLVICLFLLGNHFFDINGLLPLDTKEHQHVR